MKKKKISKQKKNTLLAFFQKRPLIGYLLLMIALILGTSVLDRGSDWWKASIFEVPQKFDGTVPPIMEVPNWVKTGGRNDRDFSDYATSELIDLPEYDADALESKCPKNDVKMLNACITYPVVYLGNYKMDHIEGAGSHIGIDIRAPKGTPVRAVANGVVVIAEEKTTGFGKHIVIKHPNAPLQGGGTDDLYSGYAHLSGIVAREGHAVEKGDIIGYVGDTGTATTSHLHFQIDRSSAPYHLWWPFSGAQASASNLNFFDAINAGLGREEGANNTINPLKWVAAFRSFSNNSSETSNTLETQTLVDFVISSENDTVSKGDIIDLEISARDSKGKIVKSYDESPSFFANDDTIDLPKLFFTNGVAKARVIAEKSGTLKMTIRDGKVIETISIVILGDDSDSDSNSDTSETIKNTENPENPNEVEKSADEVVKFDIEHDGQFRVGQSEPISIFTLDKEGTISEQDFFGTARVTLESGSGTLTKRKLTANNFSHGEAKILLTPTKKDDIILKIKAGVLVGESKKLRFSENAEKIFDDVSEDSPYAEAIADLKNRGIVSGNPDGTFRPDSEINRAEFAKVLLSALGISPKNAYGRTFTDVTRNAWFSDFAETAANLGIIKGYPDGSFGAGNSITRAELFTMLFRAAKEEAPTHLEFSDVSTDAWYANGANFAAKNNLLDFGSNFDPGEKMTRGEVAEAVSRFLAL